ncbi:MAG TPA: CDP-alcohol phosphatidyltransferase family protein [Anaerolineae bacterium]|nr:CDP-alcohol phosphatidyltransferase family protein [Anaerolineae bacterium]
MSIDKVDAQHTFRDLSDYARPLARVVTRLLAPTSISPIHITLTYTALGFAAGALYATGDPTNIAIAGALLIIKSFLDAIDGSLARARKRPSRVGRFLDSVCDYFVNAAILLGIGSAMSARIGSSWPIGLALLTLEVLTWHGTTFNYYYVVYRHMTGGDITSQVAERSDERYPWDNPAALRILYTLYRLIYGWQDRWLAAVDRRVTRDPNSSIYRDKRLLTLTTAMGLGFQLLLFAVLSWLGQPEWIFGLILGPYNIYWFGLMIYRRHKSQRIIH